MAACQGGRLVVHFTNRKNAPVLYFHMTGDATPAAGGVDRQGARQRGALVEVWQANASGKYPHPVDDHDAPLDPNFLGKGQVLTDAEGRYRIVTVKPGAYPWGNHAFGWRPAHIHFSLFGNAYAQRLITQMFFPGDPLLAIDPIFCGSCGSGSCGSCGSGSLGRPASEPGRFMSRGRGPRGGCPPPERALMLPIL